MSSPILSGLLLAVASALHVGMCTLPYQGHYGPMSVAAAAFLRAGHDVTFFVHSPAPCDDAAFMAGRRPTCEIIRAIPPDFAERTAALFRRMSAAGSMSNLDLVKHLKDLEETFIDDYIGAVGRAHRGGAHGPLAVVVADSGAVGCFDAAEAWAVPPAAFVPSTTNAPLGRATHIPALGLGWAHDMSIGERWVNKWIRSLEGVLRAELYYKQPNKLRAARGIALLGSPEVLSRGVLTFAVTVWGLDLPHALCPSFIPLGGLPPRTNASMEAELRSFLEGCEGGAVYVNFGTLAAPPQETAHAVEDALWRLAPLCAVWKVPPHDMERVQEALKGKGLGRKEGSTEAEGKNRGKAFFVSSRFASPAEVLRHPAVRVFITHCGDTSLREAIDAGVPLAGIPMFADQMDVCQRLHASGAGFFLGEKYDLVAEDVADAIRRVAGDPAYRKRVEELRKVSQALGGAETMVKTIEKLADAGALKVDPGESPLVCEVLQSRFSHVESSAWRLEGRDVELLMLCAAVVGIHLLFRQLRWLFCAVIALIKRSSKPA